MSCPQERRRRSIRLKGFDYSQPGAYFVNICTQDRKCLFGRVVNGRMMLNEAGRMVWRVWKALPGRYNFIRLDAFVVMPNHVHGIIIISDQDHLKGDHKDRPYERSFSGQGEQRGEVERRSDPRDCPFGRRGDPCDRPPTHPRGTTDGSSGRIIQAFKSITTNEYMHGVKQKGWVPFRGRLWQRNYHDRIIRDEEELYQKRQYIIENPLRWSEDPENPERLGQVE